MSNQRTEILGESTLRVVGDDSLGAFATEILGESDESGAFATEILGDDESGAWFHKLNPAYWFRSKRERSLIDVEKDSKAKTKDEAKWQKSRARQLNEAERALAAKRAAEAAHAKSDEQENRLKEIESELSGAFVGEEDPTTKRVLARKIAAAAEGQIAAAKNKRRAAHIIAKLEGDEEVTPETSAKLKKCLGLCKVIENYQRGIREKPITPAIMGYREPDPIEKSAPSASFLKGDRFVEGAAAPTAIPKERWIEMIALGTTAPSRLPAYLKQYKIVLSAANKTHLTNMVAMAKKQVAKTRSSGMGLDIWGGIKKAAMLPIAAHTYGTYKTLSLLKRGGKAIISPFRSSSSAPSPTATSQAALQARTARINAARQRRLAALKRQQAADAQTAAAQQEAQVQADAAQAEADAQQAEADAQDAAAQAEEAQYDTAAPSDDYAPGDDTSDGDDESGAFVGAFVGAESFTGGWTDSIVGEQAKKIVAAAASDSKTGKKIRAGASVAHAARKGDPKAQKAITKMATKAKAGDPQAKRDLVAVKAGDAALKAKARATRVHAVKKAKTAHAAKKVAITKKLEAAAGNSLARTSRKRQLAKVAAVEHRAAKGDHIAKAAIAKTVAKAKTGDPKAKTAVAALKLARHTRLAASTPHEKKNLAIAHKVVKKAHAGNRKAIQQVRIAQAAAKQGQPNAKRAVARLQTAAAVEHAVRTGKIVLPPGKASPANKATAAKKQYAHFSKRAASSNGTREEAIAAARAAKTLGMHDKAADLTLAARTLPSATVNLKNAATMAAAAKQGNTEAKQVVAKALGEAEKGNPAGIKSAGNLVAVNALTEMKAGRPMPANVAESVNIVRAAHAGDPEAKRTVERASAAAETGSKAGVAAAVSLSAGAALLAATASRPPARAQLVAKANAAQGIAVLPAERQEKEAELAEIYAKVQSGDASREEADRGRRIAMGLGKTGLAAEISALMPPVESADPRSSLPDLPLPPINGLGDLVKESLRAIFFATPDPLANYREGIRSRSKLG